MDKNEKLKKLEKLAWKIIKLSKDTLVTNFRFLDLALSVHDIILTNEIYLATDGKTIAYDPLYVYRCYSDNQCIPTRDYLHVVLHCIYKHMYINTLVDEELWNMACDIAVENVITGLNSKCLDAPREDKQMRILDELKERVGIITAEKLYRYFLDNPLDPARKSEIKNAFTGDDHSPWYMLPEGKAALFGYGNSPRSNPTGGGDTGDSSPEKRWSEIAEKMQEALESFGKQKGDKAGNLIQNLREVNRERYDYSEFLKQFAVREEVSRLNDDEIDNRNYALGIELFGNIPFIEPTETKEVKLIKEFIVAIDTSGSTSGELVQKFVQKTYNILKSTESFSRSVNLHIIQCDAEIQEDVKITCEEELDEYIRNMTVKGLGGTDFRPVFDYVNKLIEKKEFSNLGGLIYLTDGCGDFPEIPPEYDTAFVFVDDEYNNYDVPAWAMKVILQKDEI